MSDLPEASPFTELELKALGAALDASIRNGNGKWDATQLRGAAALLNKVSAHVLALRDRSPRNTVSLIVTTGGAPRIYLRLAVRIEGPEGRRVQVLDATEALCPPTIQDAKSVADQGVAVLVLEEGKE